jgi:hypothetical protein
LNIKALFNKPKICPFCLAEARFQRNQCPECGQSIPLMYISEYKQCPPVVINAVGFRGHGKTVFFSSLFYILQAELLTKCWPKFCHMPINEQSLKMVFDKAEELAKGILPDSTPKAFLEPALVQMTSIPTQRNCTLLIYDTGGESFENPSQLPQNAPFLKRAKTVMFLVSIPDLERPHVEMAELLNKYVLGMRNHLQASTKNQHLVVVYTKADMIDFRDGWQDLEVYLSKGSMDELVSMKGYVKGMRQVSGLLYKYTRDELRANQFLNAANMSFEDVTFSMVSALGAEPARARSGGVIRLSIKVVPLRVVDPLLWMIGKSL